MGGGSRNSKFPQYADVLITLIYLDISARKSFVFNYMLKKQLSNYLEMFIISFRVTIRTENIGMHSIQELFFLPG